MKVFYPCIFADPNTQEHTAGWVENQNLIAFGLFRQWGGMGRLEEPQMWQGTQEATFKNLDGSRTIKDMLGTFLEWPGAWPEEPKKVPGLKKEITARDDFKRHGYIVVD